MPVDEKKMSGLRDLQHSFMNFLQSQTGGVAAFVIGDETLDVATRLEIYRNAYASRLKKTIETDHPVLGSYLGDDLFERMASGYIAQCPSEVTSLRDFGKSLSDYLAGTKPFSDNPILAEIARFERQLLFAFDAADASCARVEDLQSLTAEDWPEMRVELHPSVGIFTAHWNSVESWQALRAEQAPPPAAASMQRNWMLWRGADRLTQFRALSTESEAMFFGLAQGGTFSEACEALLEKMPEDQVSVVAAGLLLQWVEAGVVSKLLAKGRPSQPNLEPPDNK
jgi:hypothetical protein